MLPESVAVFGPVSTGPGLVDESLEHPDTATAAISVASNDVDLIDFIFLVMWLMLELSLLPLEAERNDSAGAIRFAHNRSLFCLVGRVQKVLRIEARGYSA